MVVRHDRIEASQPIGERCRQPIEVHEDPAVPHLDGKLGEAACRLVEAVAPLHEGRMDERARPVVAPMVVATDEATCAPGSVDNPIATMPAHIRERSDSAAITDDDELFADEFGGEVVAIGAHFAFMPDAQPLPSKKLGLLDAEEVRRGVEGGAQCMGGVVRQRCEPAQFGAHLVRGRVQWMHPLRRWNGARGERGQSR